MILVVGIPTISPSFAPEDTYPPAVHVCCKPVLPYQIFANTIFDTHLGVFGIKWYCIFSQNNFKMNQKYFSNILKFRLKSPYVLDLNSLTPVLDPTGLYCLRYFWVGVPTFLGLFVGTTFARAP